MNKSLLEGSLCSLEQYFADDARAMKAIDFLREKVENLKDDHKLEMSLPKEIGSNDFALFSDGACRGNPGPGAWGAICQNGKGEILFELSAIDPLTTNNKMELLGAIRSLQRLQKELGGRFTQVKVHLYSDSKYVVDGITKWVSGWKRRGWKKADKKVPENIDLWQQLDELSEVNIHYHWVKGHAGHPQNERCDQLANMALDQSGN